MKSKDITFICTVFNEEKNIDEFMSSVINQTMKPGEFIIVDGGSTDKTFRILKEYSKKYKWIKPFQVKGATIADGRNFSIKKAKGDIIFTSDSSTRFEKDWIKKISNGFESGADVVFGKYYSKPKTIVEKFLASRLPNWNKINPDTFLPSNRHTAFKKEVWRKVGGFPKHIKRADDNWFHSLAHKKGFKYHFVKNAEVCWLFDRNLKNMLKLAFLDSKSEGFTHLFMERKIYFIEIVVLALMVLAITLGALIHKNIFLIPVYIVAASLIIFVLPVLNKRIKNIFISFIGIFLIILLYFAHVFGVLAGIIQSFYKKKE